MTCFWRISTVRPLSRHRLRVSEVAAKPPDKNAAGLGVGPAGVAGRAHESMVGSGSVQLGDVLLAEDGSDM